MRGDRTPDRFEDWLLGVKEETFHDIPGVLARPGGLGDVPDHSTETASVFKSQTPV